ncbi:hypothetical protein [Bradyrhizobium sp. NAS80.1]|uniref:hypothetical protein n=1 Tax=Bradyrhizobium sp. NAS80.1 TaxID=1680159 RepID=UPI000A0736B6|nr:hypothetical protein [Bradyrhizobium sp. NAS80.1]
MTRAPTIKATIIDACHDPEIWGPWFKDVESWQAWFAFLAVLFGLPLAPDQLVTFQKHTGRMMPAAGGYRDCTLIIGRRGGKSLILALIAAFLAVFIDWSPHLTGGEAGTIIIVAADKKQASVVLGYLREMLAVFDGLVTRDTAELLELANGINIEVLTPNFKTIRGRTVIAALADELAFWTVDEAGASPDVEVIAALRPSMATIPGAIMIKASSPYARKGVLHDDFVAHYGKDSPTLVWKASTQEMNPAVSADFVAAEYARDAVRASAEYGGAFRTDVTGFISRELLMQAVDQGVTTRPRIPNVEYAMFADASSGIASSGDGDRYAAGVGHVENGGVIIDHVACWFPPFNASAVTAEVAAIAKAYGCNEVVTDGFSSGFVRAELARHGIGHRISELDKSGCYLATLPLLTSGTIRLLDLSEVIAEFAALERRPGTSGRDRVDARGHEDRANVVAGVAALLAVAAPIPFAGVLEHYRRQSEAITQTVPPTLQQQFSGEAIMQGWQRRASDGFVRVVIPFATSHLYVRGCSYMTQLDGDQVVAWMTPSDALDALASPVSPFREANLPLLEKLQERAKIERYQPGDNLVGIRASDIINAAADQREAESRMPQTGAEWLAWRNSSAMETLRAIGRAPR